MRCITGEGMPRARPEETAHCKLLSLSQYPKGDLYVRFDIEFPQLSHDKVRLVIQALKDNASELNL